MWVVIFVVDCSYSEFWTLYHTRQPIQLSWAYAIFHKRLILMATECFWPSYKAVLEINNKLSKVCHMPSVLFWGGIIFSAFLLFSFPFFSTFMFFALMFMFGMFFPINKMLYFVSCNYCLNKPYTVSSLSVT